MLHSVPHTHTHTHTVSLPLDGHALLCCALPGVTGIFSKPIAGAKKDGAGGFLKGLGQGLGKRERETEREREKGRCVSQGCHDDTRGRCVYWPYSARSLLLLLLSCYGVKCGVLVMCGVAIFMALICVCDCVQICLAACLTACVMCVWQWVQWLSQ